MQMQNANSTPKVEKKVTIAEIGISDFSAEKQVQVGGAFIKVRTLIPYEKLLKMIQWGIDLIIDDRPYIATALEHIVTEMSILHAYTNIDCSLFNTTDFSADDIYETYDILEAHDCFGKVAAQIDKKQLAFYRKIMHDSIRSIIDYRNSAAGVLERLQQAAKKDAGDMDRINNILQDEKQIGVAYRLLNMMQQDGENEVDINAVKELIGDDPAAFAASLEQAQTAAE